MNVDTHHGRELSPEETGLVSGGENTFVVESSGCVDGDFIVVYLNVCTGERHTVRRASC